MMARLDWNLIRDEYVQGYEQDGIRVYPSLADLGDKYKTNTTTVKRRSTAGQWLLARAQFATKVAQGRDEKRADALSGEATMFDLECYQAAAAAIKAIKKEIDRFSEVPENDERFTRLVASMEKAQRVGRLALGDDTDRIRNSLPVFKPKFEEI